MTFFVSSSSSPAEQSAFAVATVGGIAVFSGLVLERFAEWLDDNFVPQSHKPHKWLDRLGWRILMLGIAIETIVAGGSAVSEWQTWQTAKNNNPLSQPISDVSVIVTVKLSGTNFIESPHWGAAPVAYLELRDGIMGGQQVAGNFQFLSAIKEDTTRIDYSEMIFPHESDHGYRMKFYPATGLLAQVPVIRATPMPVKLLIDHVHVLVIDVKFIPNNAEMLGGDAEVLINGNIRLDFDILPQKAFPVGKGGFDSGFTIIATNATLEALPSWMK